MCVSISVCVCVGDRKDTVTMKRHQISYMLDDVEAKGRLYQNVSPWPLQ